MGPLSASQGFWVLGRVWVCRPIPDGKRPCVVSMKRGRLSQACLLLASSDDGSAVFFRSYQKLKPALEARFKLLSSSTRPFDPLWTPTQKKASTNTCTASGRDEPGRWGIVVFTDGGRLCWRKRSASHIPLLDPLGP